MLKLPVAHSIYTSNIILAVTMLHVLSSILLYDFTAITACISAVSLSIYSVNNIVRDISEGYC